MTNRYGKIEHLVDSIMEKKPINSANITYQEIQQLLRHPVESYIIDLYSPTVLSDTVFKLQRMGLGEFTCERDIFDLIVMYELLYSLRLDLVVETFNEMIRRYYSMLLLEEKERLLIQTPNK